MRSIADYINNFSYVERRHSHLGYLKFRWSGDLSGRSPTLASLLRVVEEVPRIGLAVGGMVGEVEA